jgi:serine/threonine protein kinase
MQHSQQPGVVPLKQAYLEADPPCLEYECIAGGDLAGLPGQWQTLPPQRRAEQAAKVVRRLAEIVGTAHRLSPPIVHRDLKPANVLLAVREGGKAYYRSSPAQDPSGPTSGSERVLRGGSWFRAAWHSRCAKQYHGRSAPAQAYYGFRVACGGS